MKIMEGKSTKRKRRPSWQDNEEEPSIPTRKLRRGLDTEDVNSTVTNIMERNTANRKRNASSQENKEMPSAPARKMRRLDTTDVKSSRRRDSARRPLHGSAAREKTDQITECRGCQVEPERHADHRHRSAHEGEQVTQHYLVANSSDGPSNDHEGDQVARHSLQDNSGVAPCSAHEGEQVAPHSLVANISDEDSVKCGEPPCCQYILGHGLSPLYAAAYALFSLATTSYVLPEFFLR